MPIQKTMKIHSITSFILVVLLLAVMDPLAALENKEDENNAFYVEEIPDDFVVPRVEKSAFRKAGLPSHYDARETGNVTPVRDQRPYQLCWAFSALAVGESSLRSKGEAGPEIDLSEMHLGYFFQGPAYDPIGLSEGDATRFLMDSYLNTGNNNKFTTFALANWIGGALESNYSYLPDFYDDSLTAEDAVAGDVHLKNALWISALDTEEIKQAVMQYGAAGLSYYHKDAYLNEETHAYYNSQYTTTNHAVTIVGWDDTFPAEKFLETPEGDGAWLIKNSLGTETNDLGFFWLSYYDASISAEGATAFVFEIAPVDAGAHNYHYDGSYGTKTALVSDGGSIAAVYRCCANAEGYDEALTEVGFALADTGVEYTIQVYADLKDMEDPCSGEAVLSEPLTGSTTFCGYYSVPLPEPVQLYHDESFSIVITLTKPGASGISCFVDRSYQNGGWIAFSCSQQEGQTFSRKPGQMWQDLADQNSTARIKAITKDLPSCTARELSFKETEVSAKPGDSFAKQPEIFPDGADWPDLLWTSQNETVATVDPNGTVQVTGYGETMITVSSADGRLQASYHLSVIPEITRIWFEKEKITLPVGESLQLKLCCEPEEALPYMDAAMSVSDSSIVELDGTQVTALACGSTQITAVCQSLRVTCTISVTESIENAVITVEDQEYTGEALKPSLRVCIADTELVKDRDYSVTYQNNIDPGRAKVIVTGIGSYYGKQEVFFQILDRSPNGWVQKDRSWFYYEHGVLQVGWKKITGKWYYLASNGVMQTGWQKISGKWYYFALGGAMQTGWLKNSGKWYYFAGSGAMQTGWLMISGKTYYLKPSGVMAAGEWCGGWWLNANGSWTYPYKATWHKNSRGWWFGDASGWYAKNSTVRIDDKLYTFNSSGYMS